jgi:sec-independent protein translocase protein TatC
VAISMKTKKKQTNHRRTASPKASPAHNATAPFIEHAHELRRRFYYIAVTVLVWACAAYAVQQHLVAVLLRPAKGQHFIYTSPGGGIDFLFRVCLYTSFVIATPVIVYNLVRFIEPLISRASRQFVLWISLSSSILAVAGIVFGYYVGLPAALHFLLHQFKTIQIQPLVTIQSYLSFVLAYMLGSALLFQLPIFLLFINRIKPLKPKRLLHYERWAILAAFVLAGLMNPTPNIMSQLLIAGPFIAMYQIGILLVAFANRSKRSSEVVAVVTEPVKAATVTAFQAAAPILATVQTTPEPASQTMKPTPVMAPARFINDVRRPVRYNQPQTRVQPQIQQRPLYTRPRRVMDFTSYPFQST